MSTVGGACKVLVVTNDERTCYQLRQYLCDGGQKLLERQLSRLEPALPLPLTTPPSDNTADTVRPSAVGVL